MSNLFLQGMCGLGDNLYQRAVIRRARLRYGRIWLQTPWPQFYSDFENVLCVKPNTRLRTQSKNEQRRDLTWASLPADIRMTRWHYVADPKVSILESLASQVHVPAWPLDLSGPNFFGVKSEPYVVVRPVCLRTEWTSDSRNPNPEYIAEAIEELRPHFKIISVADLAKRIEWALNPLPYADVSYHNGELQVEQLLSLIGGAAAIVGGVGWVVPAALAYRVPLFLIYGGWGVSNGPHRLFGPNIDTSFIDQVFPDEFCMCNVNRHGCNKTISNFGARARRFALRLVQGRETAMVA